MAGYATDATVSSWTKHKGVLMNYVSRWRYQATTALALALVWPGSTLLAQQESAPAATTATVEERAEPPTVLDEIVVTAQKREENLQDVPASVTALDAEKIDMLMLGGADVKFLSGRVPSLVLESSFGRAFPRFYIRGLGNTDFDLNASQPVSMIVDEVVLENPVVKGMPLFDLERTEVLRGPQGTLFGRNTPAGIVKFDTKKPTQAFDAAVRASYGTFDNVNVMAAVGGGITETLSARASVLYQSQSDWVDNKHTGEKNALGGHDTYAYRLQFLWEPSEDFSALFNFHGWDLDGTARIFRANILKPGSNGLVSGYKQDEVFQDGRNQQEITAYGGVIKLEYDFGGAVLTSVTGYETLDMYSRGDIDGGFGASFAPPFGPGFIPFPSESADGLPDLDQITQEIRLASNSGGAFDWLFGFYYFDESLTAESFSYNSLAPGNPLDGYAFQKQDATSWALFTSFDFRPTDLWTIKAGLRYTTDEKDFSAERPDPTFQTPTVAPITTTTDADLVTWDLSATFKATESVNVYGRVGTGFRAPSIQGRILFCADFEGGTNPATNCLSVADQEKILSAEIGFKSELYDRAPTPQHGRLHLPGRRPTACRGRRRVQHRDAPERRQDQRLRPRSRHRHRAEQQLADHLRPLLQPHRDRRSESSRRPLRRRLHCHGSHHRRPGEDQRQPATARAEVHLQRHRRLPHTGRLRPLPGERRLGLQRREELLPLRVEGVPRRFARDRRARRLRLRGGEVRSGAVRPQPHGRGDRPERHRLQQPDRHDQRSAHRRTGARRPLLIEIA